MPNACGLRWTLNCQSILNTDYLYGTDGWVYFRTPNAEIMAGLISLNKNEAMMPSSLRAAMVGDRTAREINWIQP
jgi:hypothetical protein